jgi:hypothetical protein
VTKPLSPRAFRGRTAWQTTVVQVRRLRVGVGFLLVSLPSRAHAPERATGAACRVWRYLLLVRREMREQAASAGKSDAGSGTTCNVNWNEDEPEKNPTAGPAAIALADAAIV